MRRPTLLAATALFAVAWHGNDPAKGGAGSAASLSQTTPTAVPPAIAAPTAPPTAAAPVPLPEVKTAAAAAPGGHDFTADGKALLAVGACGDVPAPDGFDAKVLAAHCENIKKTQTDYLARWVAPARSF